MQKLTLAEIISTDPDGSTYSGMDNAQVANDINDKRHAFRSPVDFEKFQQFLFDNGVVFAVFTAKNDPNNSAHATAIIADQMMAFGAERLSDGIDLDNPGNDALFDGMVSGGLMTAAVRASMEALADGMESLADQNKIARVTAGMVQAERG